MHGMLEVTEGLLSVGVPTNGHMDAAVQDDIGAFEIELGTPANIFVGPRSDYKGALTLNVAIHPGRMRELAVLLADKSGMPAFGEGAWRTIAAVLLAASSDDAYKAAAPPEVLQEWAKRIDEAYGWTP